MRIAVVLLVSMLCAGCGNTWEQFMTPDFGPSRSDVAVSSERVVGGAPAVGSAPVRGHSQVFEKQAAVGAPPAGCYRGRLTDEGETCQALRTEGGALLTLGGALRGFGSGDSVCVCGFRSANQFCKQGITMIVRDISNTCADIR